MPLQPVSAEGSEHRKLSDKSKELAPAVVDMYHMQLMNVKQIADELKVSQPTISKILQAVRPNIGIHYNSEHPLDEWEGEKRLAKKGVQLKRHFFPHLQSVEVSWGDVILFEESILDAKLPHLKGSKENPDARRNAWMKWDAAHTRFLDDIGEVAARYISRHINGHAKIIVGPGRTVASAIGHIDIEWAREAEIVPFTGFLGHRRTSQSPIGNARLLERICGGAPMGNERGSLHWLPLPAILPLPEDEWRIYSASKSQSISHLHVKNLLHALPVMKSAFDLMEKADVLITSVTSAPNIARWRNLALIDKKTAELYEEWMHNSPNPPVGAISGLLFGEDGEESTVPWLPLGCGLEHMRKIVARQKHSILIAGGSPERLHGINTLIRKGCVNRLITDHVTADRLMELEK